MLSEFDLKRIQEGVLGLPAFLELVLHPADPPTPLDKRLSQLAQSIEGGTEGAVLFRSAESVDLPGRPGLTLCYQGRANIHYLALPEGPEAPPFIEAILDLPRGAAGCPEPLRSLSALNRPAELMVFIASSCPHCPQAVRAANRIALITPQVTTTIVDAQIFADLARRYMVKSVPTTILDGALTIGGVVPPIKLAEKILARTKDDYPAEVFLSMVESGRIDDAVLKIHDGFVPAWIKSATQLRMGLMLVAEKALDKDPHSMDSLVPDLLPATKSDDDALRGDTADLLGQIGHHYAKKTLESLLKDPNPDVAEIAQDALEEVEKATEA